MNRVAVFGPPYSGKSTLALALKKRGYKLVDFSRHLKVLATTALGTVHPYFTVDHITARKEEFRPFLRAFGEVIGFNDDPGFVENAVYMSGAMSAEKVVIDTPRTVPQAETLQRMGFSLVGIRLPLSKGAERSGMSVEEYRRLLDNPLEGQRELYQMAREVYWSDLFSPDELARMIEEL
jgi:hypothetical protein